MSIMSGEDQSITLKWEKFDRLTEARARFRRTPCVYAQTDKKGNVVRIGKAGQGLEPRYRGGTGYAVDAGMHASGNLIYVAKVRVSLVDLVEREAYLERKRIPNLQQSR